MKFQRRKTWFFIAFCLIFANAFQPSHRMGKPLFRIRLSSIKNKNKLLKYEFSPGSKYFSIVDQNKYQASKTNLFMSEITIVPDSTIDALVVGSGISGSTAAYYLHKYGINVMLADVKDEVGGNAISKKLDGFQWEEGPNSFQPNSASLRLAKDLGILDELVLADPKLPRYVFWQGKLHALPSGLEDLLSFNLLSWPAKIRAALGALGFVSPKPNREETIQEFVTRHLGTEVFERIIDPFVSGVYAGNPATLSMKAALKKVNALEDLGCTPSILEGAIIRVNQLAAEKKKNAERNSDLPSVPGGSLASFKNGLQSIPLKIKEILGRDRVRLNHKLINVERRGKEWFSTFQKGPGFNEIHIIRSKYLLLTTPAYVIADLFQNNKQGDLPEAEELKKINYPPVASVTLAYSKEALKAPLHGFGNLIPRSQKIRTLGTIWSSSLFPGRAPDGQALLLSFIGGSQDTNISNLTPDEIVQQVHEDNKKILLKKDSPLPRVLGVHMWAKAIPQYELGHLELLQRVDSAVQRYPGLYLGGNYRTGVAFADCIQYGTDTAKEIHSLH